MGELAKPKRKRRTKAEMEAVRAEKELDKELDKMLLIKSEATAKKCVMLRRIRHDGMKYAKGSEHTLSEGLKKEFKEAGVIA